MNMTSIVKINWTKLLITSLLIGGMFSFSATAQDKPLDAKSRMALIAELKEVVSKNAFDEEKAALVARKWDARKDLADKTKTQIINLLYEDVKAVITDSGIQYQIYSIFSVYKQMPDEQFSGQKQSPDGAVSKEKLAANLTKLTFPMHPYVGIDEELAKLPGNRANFS